MSAPISESVTVRDSRQPNADVALEPWTFNPSRWGQRAIIALIAAVAFIISVYLSLYQCRLIDSVWDPVFAEQSAKVLNSDISERIRTWILIPDAMLGALAYLGDILFSLAGSTRRWQHRPWLVAIFGLDVIPLGIVSALLVFLQGAVVGSWCFLCLSSAAISLVLVILAIDEVWSCCLFLGRVWKRSRSWRTVWTTFCGIPTEAAYEVGAGMMRPA